MSHLLYLLGLCIGIGGMLVIDRRYKLAFWRDRRRTLRSLIPAVVVFIIWDAAGIIASVFFHGTSDFSLPFTIAPEFPVEELCFLFLLCYSALLLFLGTKKLWPRT